MGESYNVLATDKFTRNVKSQSIILSSNRSYGFQPIYDNPSNCIVCNLVCNVLMATCLWCVNLYFQAMCLYWAVSAFFGLAQNIALKFPTVRRQLGIPKTPSESQQPIQELKILLQLKGEEFMRIQREGRKTKRNK